MEHISESPDCPDRLGPDHENLPPGEINLTGHAQHRRPDTDTGPAPTARDVDEAPIGGTALEKVAHYLRHACGEADERGQPISDEDARAIATLLAPLTGPSSAAKLTGRPKLPLAPAPIAPPQVPALTAGGRAPGPSTTDDAPDPCCCSAAPDWSAAMPPAAATAATPAGAPGEAARLSLPPRGAVTDLMALSALAMVLISMLFACTTCIRLRRPSLA